MFKRPLLIALFSALLLSACTQADPEGFSATASNPDLEPLPHGPWTDLAQRLAAAPDLKTATAVTREVLARGGVATFNGERVLVEPIGPAASFQATPRETLHMAMEARNRRHSGTLTVAELAKMLADFGWPFPENVVHWKPDDEYPGDVDDLAGLRQQDRNATDAEERREREEWDALAAQEDEANKVKVEELLQLALQAGQASDAARTARSKAAREDRAAADEVIAQASAARAEAYRAYSEARYAASDATRDRTRRFNALREARHQQQRLAGTIGPNYAAGEQLLASLQRWVKAAAENPKDPESFTPLFLAEMARLQDPPFDILGSSYVQPGRGDGPAVDLRGGERSGDHRLTLLELQLIVAAFHRGGQSARTALAPHHQPTEHTPGPSLLGAIFPAAYATTDPQIAKLEPVDMQASCKQFRDALGGLGGVAGGEGAGQAYKNVFGETTAKTLGDVMTSLSIVGRIVKLAAFYNNNQVTVQASPESMHKFPHGDRQRVEFIATAGVSEQDLKDYEKAIAEDGEVIDQATRECMGAVGMPEWGTIADVAKEAEDWRVQWLLTRGSPPHADIRVKFNDFVAPGMSVQLKRVTPYSAEGKLVVVIPSERADSGDVARAYVTARGSVIVPNVPGVSMLVNAGKGALGLADALSELAAGWIQAMFKPKAYASIEVEYHCRNTARAYRTEHAIADGRPALESDDCLLAEK